MGEQRHDPGDHEGEHGGEELLPAPGALGPVAAQDVARLHIVAHVGEGGAGRGGEADGEGERRDGKSDQHADDQRDQGDGEGREPTGMHGRKADANSCT